jgi:hypothetical protein
MAPTLYPRGTVKKIIKAHSNRQVSKNVDILVLIPSRSCLYYPTANNAEDIPQLRALHARVHLNLYCTTGEMTDNRQVDQRSIDQVETERREGNFGAEYSESQREDVEEIQGLAVKTRIALEFRRIRFSMIPVGLSSK